VTTIRTVAAHDIVEAVHPHPVAEEDKLGIAAGKAIDTVLAEFSHSVRIGRRPTITSLRRLAADRLDDELAELAHAIPAEVRQVELARIDSVLQAFRTSEVAGLARPKSRLVLLDEEVGFYAQPDYWNGRDRFYEMKSYRADPIPPAVELQLALFQLAFPQFRAFLACFDRHALPAVATVREIPPLPEEAASRVLRTAQQVARASGQEKVLEYVDSPTVRYRVPGTGP
jgi:hypothetical protein